MSCGLCRWAEICEVCHMLSACSPGFVPRTELRMICVALSQECSSLLRGWGHLLPGVSFTGEGSTDPECDALCLTTFNECRSNLKIFGSRCQNWLP